MTNLFLQFSGNSGANDILLHFTFWAPKHAKSCQHQKIVIFYNFEKEKLYTGEGDGTARQPVVFYF